MKAYYVKYTISTGSHACIVPAKDAFNAVTVILQRLGMTFKDLQSIKSCPVSIA